MRNRLHGHIGTKYQTQYQRRIVESVKEELTFTGEDNDLIRQFGGLPPREKAYLNSNGAPQEPPLGIVIPIPCGVESGTGSLVVAIRVWDWPDWARFNDAKGFQGVSFGDVNLINEKRQEPRTSCSSRFCWLPLPDSHCSCCAQANASISGLPLTDCV